MQLTSAVTLSNVRIVLDASGLASPVTLRAPRLVRPLIVGVGGNLTARNIIFANARWVASGFVNGGFMQIGEPQPQPQPHPQQEAKEGM
jgi:hypothetical protein